MASMSTSRAASPADDLYDYSANIDELFAGLDEEIDLAPHPRSNNQPSSTTNSQPRPVASQPPNTVSLGLDSEVKVAKKRAQIPKLDGERLLSQAGIPRLRSMAKSKLLPKFKGKGHEYTDAARLLTFYQLWLDDLYPRAKFADALALVEKAGHSKRMVVMRREWIDEGKPKKDYLEDEPEVTPRKPIRRTDEVGDGADRMEGVEMEKTDPEARTQNGTPQPRDSEIPDTDELDALLAEQEQLSRDNAPPPPQQPEGRRSLFGPFPTATTIPITTSTTTPASAAQPSHEHTQPRRIRNSLFFASDDSDPEPPAPEELEEDELDALLASQKSKEAPLEAEPQEKQQQQQQSQSQSWSDGPGPIPSSPATISTNARVGVGPGDGKVCGREANVGEFNFDDDEEAMAEFGDVPW